MASTKRAPKVSKISRAPVVAFARKQRPTGEQGVVDEAEPAPDAADKPASAPPATAEAASPTPAPAAAPAPAPAPVAVAAPAPAPAPAPASAAVAAPAPAPAPTPAAAPAPAPAAAAAAAPAPAPAPEAERPAEPEPELTRARVATVVMPSHAALGGPPAMPPGAAPVAAPPSDVSAAESPTHMPGPREIPPGHPDDPARPPGAVPSGDSRSLRRRADRYEFALIYRIQTYVISRFGAVGTRGQWRVVEYPTSASASHAYAKECSRFAADGFSDYRE